MSKSEYADIHARVAKAQAASPSALRAELTDLFVNHPAVAPHDMCSAATAKMVRYKLANGKSLGHQIDSAPQHLWFAENGTLPTSVSAIARLYPATAKGEGRHSNVNQMPDLRDKAVARVTVTSLEQAKALLNELLA